MPESQDNITISDQPAAKDSLGLTPYVIAMTEFLTHPDTKPPLTISIEGEWGSGKSSFMKQLEDQIKVKSKEIKNKKLAELWTRLKKDYFLFSDLSDIWLFLELKFSQETQTVWFNAWRHDKSESLWATFALSFLEQIAKNRDFSDFIPNIYSSLQLFIKRLDFKEKPVKSIQTLGLGVVISGVILLIIVGFIDIVFFRVGLTGFSNRYNQVVELIAKPKTKDNNPQKDAANTENLLLNLSLLLGGAGGSLVGVNKLFTKLQELIGDPKMDLTQYLESPDYKSQVAFVEKFHEDFRKIVEAYIGVDEKVYVFIDDLDRCELDKAADLLQALNMMISNDPQIIFILGMDREKVAAAITYKQKDVLPYLASIAGTNLDPTQENYAVVKQLDYGFSYLEKFVQLSFSLPKPSENTLDSFFAGLYLNEGENKNSQEKRIFGIPKNLIIETIDNVQHGVLFNNIIDSLENGFSSVIEGTKDKINYVKTELVKKFQKGKKEDNAQLEADAATDDDTELEANTASTVQEATKYKRPELAIFPMLKKDLDNKEKEDLIKMVAPFFENNPRRL
ncbi:MAG: P-loop NTPase fold protein, partial [Sphaerospermopsis kisseleviana]